MAMYDEYLVKPGVNLRLADHDPDDRGKFRGEAETIGELARLRERLVDLQALLYADNRYALLVVVQAMDSGGKDGLIRSVFAGVDPCGCHVTSFKVPSDLEVHHDFLWRVHQAVPGYGNIGIFNRSHYEDVLVPRVHRRIPKSVCRERYAHIRAFERLLAENRVAIIKLFLHISKGEQEERLAARLLNPRKNWKFSVADLHERRHWDDYMDAYERALEETSAEHAPWYVIPANRKWYRNVVVTRIVTDKLESLGLEYPEANPGVKALAEEVRRTGRLPAAIRPEDAP